MVSSDGTSFANGFEQYVRCMLASMHHEDDIDTVLDAGITEACFVGAEHYWKALQYIIGRIRKGKKISKTYLKRKYGVELPLGADDPKLYADEVVLATARAQADRIIADLDEANHDTVKSDEFYDGIRKARNLLRDVAAPNSVIARSLNGQSVKYTEDGSMAKPPPQKWIVRGLVPDDVRTFLYGRGGSAKSYLAVYLAVAVATGTPFLDVPAKKGKVLYIDWEACEETFRARVNRVANNLGIDLSQGMSNILYKRLYGPLNEHLDDIIEECRDEDITLVIIDSFGFSMSGQDTSAQPDVTAQMARLAQIPAATVVIDHISKNGRGEDGPFGSVYKHAAARWMWWLRAASKEPCPDGEVKPGIFVRMNNTKHNIAAQQEDIYLHLVWDDDFDANTVSVQKVDKDKVPSSLTDNDREVKGEVELSPGQKDFLRFLKSIYVDTHKAATQNDMVECMGVGVRQVRNTAESLSELGLIRLIDLKAKAVNGKRARPGRGYLLAGEVQALDTTEAEAKV